MAIRDIVLYPSPGLREKCAPVEEITDEIRALLDDMAETMYHAPGIGLAAPQVGVQQRVIVIDVGGREGEPLEDDEESGGEEAVEVAAPPTGESPATLLKLINPEITHAEGSVSSEEGCLSIPGIRESIKRAERVVVEALDEVGEKRVIDAQGLLAICLQHEIDHLNGVLFIDHLSRIKRQLLKSKLKKTQGE